MIENAIYFATATGATVTPHDREDAIKFLIDAEDARLERWCAGLDLDPDAIRDGCRARLRRHDGERSVGA